MESIFPQWVQDADTGLSLLSFFFTLYVMIEVHTIKNSFLARARLPEYLEDLRSAGSKLNSSFDEWPTHRHLAREQIKICLSILNSSRSILPKEEKEEINKVIDKLSAAKDGFNLQKSNDKDEMWELYSEIQFAITSMNQLLKNNRWK